MVFIWEGQEARGDTALLEDVEGSQTLTAEKDELASYTPGLD